LQGVAVAPVQNVRSALPDVGGLRVQACVQAAWMATVNAAIWIAVLADARVLPLGRHTMCQTGPVQHHRRRNIQAGSNPCCSLAICKACNVKCEVVLYASAGPRRAPCQPPRCVSLVVAALCCAGARRPRRRPALGLGCCSAAGRGARSRVEYVRVTLRVGCVRGARATPHTDTRRTPSEHRPDPILFGDGLRCMGAWRGLHVQCPELRRTV